MPKLQLSYAPEKHGFCHPAPSDFMKLAEMSVLHLTHFKDRLVSASRGSYQNSKSYPSQYFASMKTHQTASFNMMVNEVHNSISLESDGFRK